MKPEELYSLETNGISFDVGVLGDFFPEVNYSLWYTAENTRMEIRTHVDYDFDHRRCWTLRSLWLDGKPFMIIQSAGREGRDHRERIITDIEVFKKAVLYLIELCMNQESFVEDELGNDVYNFETHGSVDAFYGCNLEAINSKDL